MPIVDAYAIRKKQEVMEDCWGHLRPKQRHSYRGTIIFTHGEYGDIVCIRSDFKSLPSSPWFYHDLHAFLGEHCAGDTEGTVFRFAGSYRVSHKDRQGVFDGKVETVTIA